MSLILEQQTVYCYVLLRYESEGLCFVRSKKNRIRGHLSKMAEMFTNLKHGIHAAYKSAAEGMMDTLKESKFLEEGVLTPEEVLFHFSLNSLCTVRGCR